VIVRHLEKYGQFGPGFPAAGVEGAYDNSYLIADSKEAWILETAGTRWVAKRLAAGTAAISNKLGIGTSWDLASCDLVKYALKKGWWSREKERGFDFEAAYSADEPAAKAGSERAQVRAECSAGLLREQEREIDPRLMMRIARDRSTTPSLDNEQTASSCVAVLPRAGDGIPVFWWCAVRPSDGCYVPFFVDGEMIPAIVSAAGTHGRKVVSPDKAGADAFSESSYWWLCKDLCAMVEADRNTRGPIIRGTFDRLEEEFEAGTAVVVQKAALLRAAGKRGEAAKLLLCPHGARRGRKMALRAQ